MTFMPRALRRLLRGLFCLLAPVAPCAAQTAPATPPSSADTPSIKVGVLLFADYTVQQEPKVTDADGNEVTFNAFQIGRTYINVTGNISKTIAFRITPDIVRETGVGSALNGSYTFRLKYAFAQWNLDEHLGAGSYARFGLQQNPYHDFFDPVYRYRFQGTVFVEREGYVGTSDAGAAFHYNLPNDYGDIQTGFFNGENYQRFEVNDQKSFRVRGTLRPLPGSAALHGLRLTGYYDKDAYVKNADRTRALFAATFEHRYLNAGYEYLSAKDQISANARSLDARGWSVFVTPRTSIGWEGLVRFDHNRPDKTFENRIRERTIAGVAYWFPHQGNVSAALMFDVDNATFDGFSPVQPTQRRLAVHALVSF